MKFSLASVFFTFFVDSLCWAIVFPIFAPYFLNVGNPLFATTVTMATRTTILGFFLMAFSLGQFLGAPIIGDYADRFGRRKALLITIPCICLGLALTAWSMMAYHLVFLFLGRLITGIFASNGEICLACVADLSENKATKAKNFGYFSVLAGASFVVGAFLGGKLSDPTVNASFSPELPIWIACSIGVLNFLFVFFGFKETIHIDPSKKFCFFSSFQNIKTALQTKRIHKIYAAYFFFLFSWAILLQFIPVIMVKRYHFTGSNIGDLALFVGICWSLGSSYIKQWLRIRFPISHILKISFLMSVLFLGYVSYPKHIYNLLAVLALCVVTGAIIWPLCTTIISDLAPPQMQGKILSISGSIQALAVTIASVIGGISFQWSLHIPFLIAASGVFLAGLLFWTHSYDPSRKN